MDFIKISHEILAIDSSMRYVEIMGRDGELLLNKMKQEKYSVKAQRKEELLSLDLYNAKQMEKKFNKTLGNVAFTHVFRTKVHQLVWYHDDCIIYCTCEGDNDNSKIIEILRKIETVLGISKPIELSNFFEIPN